ncbi:MAG: hypothetical protein ACI8WB_005221 [Phenylobacterium sp.]|jgi:hypothetical protein
MLIPLLAPILHITTIVLLLAITAKYTVLRFNFKWIAVSVFIFTSYWLVKVTGFELINVKAFYPSLSWPWGQN